MVPGAVLEMERYTVEIEASASGAAPPWALGMAHHHAAVHGQNLACDVARRRAGQKERHPRDVLR